MITYVYFIDKTMMIKNIIDEHKGIFLFTRPRRFGKTLNMDMLKTFFEIPYESLEEDTSSYFIHTHIWHQGEYYQSYQGRYPVIWITFKDSRGKKWANKFNDIKEIIGEEFRRHAYLLKGDLLEEDKDMISSFIKGEAPHNKYGSALWYLSKLLYDYHHQPVIVIIDEYDTPINSGYVNGYYDEVMEFMRNIFSKTLKDNRYVAYSFLTGINRVAKESIFSGLNNLKEYSILDDKYSQYFGFTHQEVKELLSYYRLTDHYEEVYQWYEGYNFGPQALFNPWSVLYCVYDQGAPKAFWVNTSSNDIIGSLIKNADNDIRKDLVALMEGKTLSIDADVSLVYPTINNNPQALFTLLLNAGYLKPLHMIKADSHVICEVMIPNKEVRYAYSHEIIYALGIKDAFTTSVNIGIALRDNNMAAFSNFLETYLINTISYYDTIHEDFYQGLLLGLYASISSEYYILSNRECGEGRYDISIEPKASCEAHRFGFIIELKVLHHSDSKTSINNQLDTLAHEAIQQIKVHKYDNDMNQKGIPVVKMGVAFYQKEVRLAYEI